MLILSSWRRETVRSAVVTIAIAASFCLVIVLSSLSVGIRESSRRSIENVGADFYVVPEGLHPLLIDLQRFDQGWDVQRNLEGSPYPVEVQAPRMSDSIFYFKGSDMGEVNAIGVDPEKEFHFDQFRMVEGNGFQTNNDPVREQYIQNGIVDPASITGELIVSREFSDDMDLDIGDTISLTPTLKGDLSHEYIVKGIFIDSLSRLSSSVIVPLGELQYLKGYLKNDTLTEILVDIRDDSDSEKMKEWSQTGDFTYRDIVDLLDPEEMLDEIFGFIGIISGFSGMVTGVTLAVCTIFTSIIFVISAKERSRDNAIMRIIGIPATRIMTYILMESSLFYIAGLLLGVIAGTLVVGTLNRRLIDSFSMVPEGFVPFMLDARVLLIALFASLILAVISSVLPSIIAYMSSPIESLRGDVS